MAVGMSYSKPGFYITKHGFYRKINRMYEEYNQYGNWVSFMVDGPQHTFLFWQDQISEDEVAANPDIKNKDNLPPCNMYWADTTGKFGMGKTGEPLLTTWLSNFQQHVPAQTRCFGPEMLDKDGWGGWNSWFHKSTAYCDRAL